MNREAHSYHVLQGKPIGSLARRVTYSGLLFWSHGVDPPAMGNPNCFARWQSSAAGLFAVVAVVVAGDGHAAAPTATAERGTANRNRL